MGFSINSALGNSKREITITVAENTHDQTVIMDFVLNSKGSLQKKLSLLDKITDESIHAEIVKKTKNKAVRIKAYEKMTNQSIRDELIRKQIPKCKNGQHNATFTYTESKSASDVSWIVTVKICVFCGKKTKDEGLPHIII